MINFIIENSMQNEHCIFESFFKFCRDGKLCGLAVTYFFKSMYNFSLGQKWGPPQPGSGYGARCGISHRADCDSSGANPCCSKHGYCGSTDEHCKCDECFDFRNDGEFSKCEVGGHSQKTNTKNGNIRIPLPLAR